MVYVSQPPRCRCNVWCVRFESDISLDLSTKTGICCFSDKHYGATLKTSCLVARAIYQIESLIPNEQCFSYGMARVNYISMCDIVDKVRFVQYQHGYLDFHRAISLKQQSTG
jgi:hypothetical protein